nr:WYL domain-containing protein [Caldicoprobacter guelmensis]
MLQTRQMMSTKEIAEILDITPRNVKAYIEYLKKAGIPVQGMPGRAGGYYLGNEYYFEVPKLDEGEYSALILAEKLLNSKSGFPLANELQTAVAKIRCALGDMVVNVFPIPTDELMLSLGKVDLKDNLNKILSTVYMAIKQRKRIRILYYTASRDERKRREVDPYAVVYREGSWYLIGYCHLREQVRTFKLVRIEEIEILDTTFVYPSDFSIKEYMSNIFSVIEGEEYDVEIRFFHPASIWIKEKKWLPNQQIEALEDGSVIFKARVKGLIDIKRWVLSFGKLAVVQKPEELVESIREEIEGMKDLYVGSCCEEEQPCEEERPCETEEGN